MKTESPQDYVNRILRETGLSHVKVSERARARGHKISAGYVNNICQGDADNPSIKLVQALAHGLGRPEDEVFAVFRGKPLTEETKYGESFFATMWEEFHKLPAAKQREIMPIIEMTLREISRLSR